MNDDDLFKLFWDYHHERLLNFACRVAWGHWRDAEDGLQVAMCELWPMVVEHFKGVSIKDRTDGQKAILPLLWIRIRYRVWDVRRKSERHEMPLGQSVLPVEALDDPPAKTGDGSTDAAVDEVAKVLTTKMNQLSDMEKRVIELTFLREPAMTDDEAAQEIGTTPGTVKARRCSALRKLRQ